MKNSQFGTCWISNYETRESQKIPKNELEIYLNAGWVKKRIISFDALDAKEKQKQQLKEERQAIQEAKRENEFVILNPLFVRLQNGESIRDVAEDYEFSFPI